MALVIKLSTWMILKVQKWRWPNFTHRAKLEILSWSESLEIHVIWFDVSIT